MIDIGKINDELEILRNMGKLDKEIEVAITKVDILATRLFLILRPESDREISEKNMSVSITTLGAKIQEQIDNVHKIVENLDSLISRLEI